jgi:hypothetical protein
MPVTWSQFEVGDTTPSAGAPVDEISDDVADYGL